MVYLGMLRNNRAYLAAFVLALSAGISLPAVSQTDTSLHEYNYYESGKLELNTGNFEAALDHYHALEKEYPKSQYLEQAQLEIAYTYYKLGKHEATIELLNKFIERNDKNAHLPYAYYLAGLSEYKFSLDLIETSSSSENVKNISDATQKTLSYFTTLIDKFPDSQYADDAKEKTTHLLEKVILHRVVSNEDNKLQTRLARIKKESALSVDWLMKQSPRRYTLQLIRAPYYDTVFKVALQYQLADKATIIETYSTTGVEYTLLYGIFRNKEKAMNEGATLPSALLDSKPQVRELASLQSEIKKSRLIQADLSRSQLNAEVALAKPTVETAPKPMFEEGVAYREKWLLKQTPDHFTVQLSGASTEGAIVSYINEHELIGHVAYFKSNRQGKEWYSLLHGSYKDKESAVNASKTLSEQLGIEHPWVRNYKSVHVSIGNAQ